MAKDNFFRLSLKINKSCKSLLTKLNNTWNNVIRYPMIVALQPYSSKIKISVMNIIQSLIK
jgi:hypothetical protein